MVRTQIQIRSEQLSWLKRQALSKGVSMSQMIRDSIDYFRSYSEKSSRLESIKENALNAVGSFSTGTGRTPPD